MKPEIIICMGSSCFARGNEANLDVIENWLKVNGLKDEVDVKLGCCLCQGECGDGPNVTVNGKKYHGVDKGIMLDILRKIKP